MMKLPGGKFILEVYIDDQKRQQLVTLGYLSPLRLHDELAVQRAFQAFVNDIPKLAVKNGDVPKDVAISKGMFSEEEYAEWLTARG